MTNKNINLLSFISGFIFLNLIWYIFSLSLEIKALPLPHEVYADWPRALENDIFTHLKASFLRVIAGLGLSLILALFLGIFMGVSKKINCLLEPFVYFSYPIPKLALLPIIMVILGIGEIPKIIIIVLIVVFQMTLSIRDAIVSVPDENYALLISLRANLWQKIRHIVLPATLPAILSSLRISVGIALSALFFTESFGAIHGLGFYITDCWMRLDYLQMYFGLCLLALAGFFLFILLDILEKHLCPWNK